MLSQLPSIRSRYLPCILYGILVLTLYFTIIEFIWARSTWSIIFVEKKILFSFARNKSKIFDKAYVLDKARKKKYIQRGIETLSTLKNKPNVVKAVKFATSNARTRLRTLTGHQKDTSSLETTLSPTTKSFRTIFKLERTKRNVRLSYWWLLGSWYP